MSLVTFVAAGDNHGDKADPEALEALWEFCRDCLIDVLGSKSQHICIETSTKSAIR